MSQTRYESGQNLPMDGAVALSLSEAARHKLSAESHQSFLGGLASGFTKRLDDAIQHPLTTGVEVASSFAIGAGLALLSRNPEALGGFAGRMAGIAPKTFGVLAVGDITRRVLTAHNGGELGSNLGSALFDYSLMGVSGGIGARSAFAFADKLPQVRLSFGASSQTPLSDASGSPRRIAIETHSTVQDVPVRMSGAQAAGTAEDGIQRFTYGNGDAVTYYSKAGAHLTESVDGTETYHFDNGEWLWKHPDGVTVEGKLVPTNAEEQGWTPPEYKITTTYPDGSTSADFPGSRKYLQHIPTEFNATRADTLLSADNGIITHQSPAGETIVRSADGTETVSYADGSKSTQFPTGADIFEGADGSKFARFPDGNWHWTHPDGTTVNGEYRSFASNEEYFKHAEESGYRDAMQADYKVQTTLPDGTTHDGYPLPEGYIKQPFTRTTGDKMRTTAFPAGHTVLESPDGARETIFPDGRDQIENPDGVKETKYIDGTLMMEEPNGEVTYSFANGDSIHKLPDGTYQELSGHKVTTTAADGTVSERYVTRQQFGGWESTVVDGNVVAHNGFGESASTTPDGVETLKFEHGPAAVRQPNGSEILTSPDGTTFYRFPNGDWLWTHPNGTAVEGRLTDPLPEGTPGYDAPFNSEYKVITTNPDGRVTAGYPEGDGYITQPYSRTMRFSSYRLTKFPDGRMLGEHASGQRDVMLPDQTVIETQPNGDVSTTYPSGAWSHETARGSTYQLGENDTVTFNQNGDIVETLPDKVVEHRADGTVITQTATGLRLVESANGERYYTDGSGFRLIQTPDGQWRMP